VPAEFQIGFARICRIWSLIQAYCDLIVSSVTAKSEILSESLQPFIAGNRSSSFGDPYDGARRVTVSDINQVLFNTAQLATWDQARQYAKILSSGPIVVGGGVHVENHDSNVSGIYIPAWESGPGGFAEPNYIDPQTGVKYLFLHYRFVNGAVGMNVGLIMDKFKRYPNSPLYVLSALAQEAASLATH
jgi:hypothetical protein